MRLQPWSDRIDPATIPDEVLKTERARRNAALRTTFNSGRNGGRPKNKYPCAACGEVIEGRAELQKHWSVCPNMKHHTRGPER